MLLFVLLLYVGFLSYMTNSVKRIFFFISVLFFPFFPSPLPLLFQGRIFILGGGFRQLAALMSCG